MADFIQILYNCKINKVQEISLINADLIKEVKRVVYDGDEEYYATIIMIDGEEYETFNKYNDFRFK